MTDHRDPSHNTLLAAAAQQLDAANTLMAGLTTAARDLKESYQISRRLRITLVIGAALLLLSVTTNVTVVVLAVQQRSISAANQRVLAAIRDCTDQHGQCAQQSEQHTATAVAKIIARDVEDFIIVIECDRVATSDQALETCVTHRLPRG